MSQNQCVLFGVIAYHPDVEFEELNQIEEDLVAGLAEVLARFGAENLDFWRTPDALQFRGAFAEYEIGELRLLCDEIRPLLTHEATARLVPVDCGLYNLSVFFVAPNGWREESVDMTDRYNQG